VYKKYFEEAHLQIGSEPGKGLEEYFHNVFISNNIRHSLFSVAPVISGVGGGTGKYYKNPALRKIKEMIRIKLVRLNGSYKSLFAGS
jgi:hypothetical protein